MQQHKAQGGQVSQGKAAAARRGQEVTNSCGLQSSNNHGGYWKGTSRTKESSRYTAPSVGVGTVGSQSHIANLTCGRSQPCQTVRFTFIVTCYTEGTSLIAEYETKV